jgi:hypothetical protein
MVLMYLPFDATLEQTFPAWTFYVSVLCVLLY